jgi:hypothetical protein
MDPIETVQSFLARASRLLHLQSTTIPSLPSDSLVASLVTIRAMLERMAEFTPSESDISAFCILASLDNIRVLLECRRHPECAQVDSWSNIILADLSKFAFKVISNSSHSGPLTDSTVDRAMSRMYLEACSQLPGKYRHTACFLCHNLSSPVGILYCLLWTPRDIPNGSRCAPSSALSGNCTSTSTISY